MFHGFERKSIRTSGTEINLVTGGHGPGLLLLHGYPQTHAIWHKVAPKLAEHFTVVAADLRGYGDSGKPPTDQRHTPYSKREMARDQAEVMSALGIERFSVVGHDRGARVGHRLARDYRERVERLAVLDICPTLDMYETTDMAFASAYYHWFFLIQPADYPERMIGADPDFYLSKKLKYLADESAITDEAMAEYLRCFRDPATIHASCEDYRAAAGIDLDHDRQDRDAPLDIPVLALWGEKGIIGKLYRPLEVWQDYTTGPVTGGAVPSGHYIPEEVPERLLAELSAFLEG
ncbi:alpha/beta hydrolase [Nisaea acidiphila]|uniref:Alpha/beta hydrolase n=1 Tax=Nisaea acidiphila TaxID=1862145 RepID=A0A9J7AUH6_9PROT|nr:alpha/beta hydrolase [Nisaea acidiphila]UUX50129.1 alpha/beta hydrolase [Nisaea acidiphila]